MPIEQQIEEAIYLAGRGDDISEGLAAFIAPSVAKIALELAEKAYDEGRYFGREEAGIYQKFGDGVTFKQFIQDYIGD